MGSKPIAIGDNDFEQQVLKSEIPVIVDFWAPWCGPCRAVAPVLEELATEYDGKMTVAKINTDDHQRWMTKFGIQGIPTMIIFKGGEEINRIVGAGPQVRRVLREAFDKAITSA